MLVDTKALACALLVAASVGCGALGAGRALSEAEELVERLPCRDASPCTADAKTVYFTVSAREYLAEARRRTQHGHHAQAERFAVQARKAAEAALRALEGE